MAGRIAAVLGIVIVMLALSTAGQPAPTILAVVVEVQPGAVRILSATAVRGAIRESSPDLLATVPRTANNLLVEYVYRTSDATSRVIQTGMFHVRLQPIIEEPRYGPPVPAPTEQTPAKKRVVVIAVPDVPGATEMSFARLTPVAGVPTDKWERVSLGQAPLPTARR